MGPSPMARTRDGEMAAAGDFGGALHREFVDRRVRLAGADDLAAFLLIDRGERAR